MSLGFEDALGYDGTPSLIQQSAEKFDAETDASAGRQKKTE